MFTFIKWKSFSLSHGTIAVSNLFDSRIEGQKKGDKNDGPYCVIKYWAIP